MMQFTRNLAFFCSNFITFLELEIEKMKKASLLRNEWKSEKKKKRVS